MAMTIEGFAAAFRSPGREYTLLPFWFWNDDLREEELFRQIEEFDRHGVYGFVIHPRVGLPRDIGWMSDRMLHLMRVVVEEAARRRMKVVLYDEGMYPPGSSSGQVVAEDPRFQVRGLARVKIERGEGLSLQEDWNFVYSYLGGDDAEYAVIDRPIHGVIRGLHYTGEGPAEDEPLASDLLNPDAVACFLRLVYDRYARVLGDHFGKTIIGIYTDEPALVGRLSEWNIAPGTTDILEHVERILGYDFTPHLPMLWDDAAPDALSMRSAYEHAVHKRLEETYYRQLSGWCMQHGIALMGHPAGPADIGLERYFHIPGQDLVWRWVIPDDPSALEGPESTQAKCSSSAMAHQGRKRNSNECFGAYGHELTYDEVRWLTDWCLVRGVNMLIPHAFYYSVRGPRRDERPPDVGPNSPWWDGYRVFADYCRRLCRLNAESEHVCKIAILGGSSELPWSAAKVCFTNQRDFNYIETRDLWEAARVDSGGIHIAGMTYEALIVDRIPLPAEAQPAVQTLTKAGRVIAWDPEAGSAHLPGMVVARRPQELLTALDSLTAPDLTVSFPAPHLRCRHVRKDGFDVYLLFNEGERTLECVVNTSLPGNRYWINPLTCAFKPARPESYLYLARHQTTLLVVARDE